MKFVIKHMNCFELKKFVTLEYKKKKKYIKVMWRVKCEENLGEVMVCRV